MTLGEIAIAVRAEGGFDATDAQVQAWALDRIRRLVGGAQWAMRDRELAATVAGQAVYPLADEIVDVRSVSVDGAKYRRISVTELWDVKSDELTVLSRGVFAPAYDDDQQADSFEVWPVPIEDGKEIRGLVAVLPVDTLATEQPPIPRDFDHVIVEGCIADGLARIDERLPEADRWEGLFATGVEALRRRRNSRIGSGPSRIRVGG